VTLTVAVIPLVLNDLLYQVFEAAMSWLKKDEAGNRTHAVADVLKCVRLPLLAPYYLTDKVAKESLIHNSLPCRLTTGSFVGKCVAKYSCYVVTHNICLVMTVCVIRGRLQNCTVLYCLPLLCTVICYTHTCTHTRAVLMGDC